MRRLALLAAPLAGPCRRTPRAIADKLRVRERARRVIAAHIARSGRLETSTVESVRFEPPHLVSFRVLCGPVPHVSETYELGESGAGTNFTYSGELGADLWGLGSRWGGRVAAAWERAVAEFLDAIQAEAERLAS